MSLYILDQFHVYRASYLVFQNKSSLLQKKIAECLLQKAYIQIKLEPFCVESHNSKFKSLINEFKAFKVCTIDFSSLNLIAMKGIFPFPLLWSWSRQSLCHHRWISLLILSYSRFYLQDSVYCTFKAEIGSKFVRRIRNILQIDRK